ncbi:hypothetical protein SGLAM104S_09219 [Streptomyces glaucescens]
MEAVPARARVYVAGVALGALSCLEPLSTGRAPWWAIALLAVLHACGERITGRGSPGTCHPVLLAGAFLLSPPAAALVAVPGALLSRVEQRPVLLRRVWRAAELVLAVWAAARVFRALGGPDAVGAADFPYALLPAAAAVPVFCAVLALLDGSVLVLAEHVPPRRAWRGLFARSLAPLAVHGLAGLMMAVLWRSPYGRPPRCWCCCRCASPGGPSPSTTGSRPPTRPPSGPSYRPSTSRTATPAATASGSGRPR